MRIWISGGGTAGHVYPALTVLDSCDAESVDVTWLGRSGSLEEELVVRQGLPFQPIVAAPMVGVSVLGRVRNSFTLLRGALFCWRMIGRSRPDVVLVTGGYVTVPVSLAARARRVPLAVYLPDVRPGKAVAFIARLADRVFVTTDRALDELPQSKTVVTGYPVRQSIRSADRDAERARLGITPDERLILLFGGSQGARRINDAIISAAGSLLERCTLVHVSGPLDYETILEARRQQPEHLRRRWLLNSYLHGRDMAAALAAADLVVCRAGAATLGELPARGVPAILVPLPIAGGHQGDNAAVLAGAGGAVVVDDSDLTGDRLRAEVFALLDSQDKLDQMSDSMRGLDKPDASSAIFHELSAMAALPGRA